MVPIGRAELLHLRRFDVTRAGPGSCPQWSPDGSLIAAFGPGDPTYANDVALAVLPLQSAIPCSLAWAPHAVLLP
jgi:hypothetical protein